MPYATIATGAAFGWRVYDLSWLLCPLHSTAHIPRQKGTTTGIAKEGVEIRPTSPGCVPSLPHLTCAVTLQHSPATPLYQLNEHCPQNARTLARPVRRLRAYHFLLETVDRPQTLPQYCTASRISFWWLPNFPLSASRISRVTVLGGPIKNARISNTKATAPPLR